MTDFHDQKNAELLLSEKITQAEKMITDGVPIAVVCRMLGISPLQLENLRQSGEARFK